jgi:signal transduction histidine kinase
MRVRWSDPDRWRQVGFHLLGIFLAVLTLGGAVVAWGLTGANIGGLVTERRLGVAVAQGLFVLVLVGAAPRATQALAELHVRVTAWFLGPDRVAVLEAELVEQERRRREILDAVAAERHRIERNLHDGAQQRLVALGIDLGMAASKLPDDPEAARGLVEAAREKARTSLGELRMIGRGLHPAILEDRGLDAALSSVVADAPVPIELDVPSTLRLSPTVEETAYFVAAEAVANVVKHSGARTASIRVTHAGDLLSMVVHDDGRGGADPGVGSGIAGMAARVRAADGQFTCSSPPGGPTVITIDLPTTPPGVGAGDG